MSATRMRIEAGRLLVEADEAGRLTTVSLRRPDPHRPVLHDVDLGSCRVDGSEIDWTSRAATLDADEVNVQLSGADVDIQLRHSFSTGWTTRLLIMNTGTLPRSVEGLQLNARPAADQHVSALVAGSRLCWAMQSATGTGPVLTARLMSGAVHSVTPAGFEIGRLRLAPGQRYVTQLRWEVLATPRSVVSGPGRDVLLTRTTYEVDEPVLLPDDPDAALVAPSDVGVDTVDEPGAHGRELTAVAPGRHRVELRSAEGDVRLDLSWVDPLADQLATWTAGLLAGRRTGAGVVALAGTPAAIVVQAALGGGQLEDAELAVDALDRHTALLLDDDGDARPDPLAVLYLLGEHGRTGDPDVLARAFAQETSLLAAEEAPPPGLGLAVLRTVLAGVDAHERVTPLVLSALQRVTAVVDRGRQRDPGPVASTAELELLLAVRPLLPPEHPAHEQLVGLVSRLGAAVGAGLPGRLVVPPPVAEHAHLVTVLRMLPEDGVAGVTRAWGAAPTMLAHRLTLEVLDRLTGPEPPPIGPAAAWLALGQRHA